MTIKGTGKIVQISSARTRYISIPSVIASDSSFQFKDGEYVQIEINPDTGDLTIKKKG
jgi:hypothetical protein